MIRNHRFTLSLIHLFILEKTTSSKAGHFYRHTDNRSSQDANSPNVDSPPPTVLRVWHFLGGTFEITVARSSNT